MSIAPTRAQTQELYYDDGGADFGFVAPPGAIAAVRFICDSPHRYQILALKYYIWGEMKPVRVGVLDSNFNPIFWLDVTPYEGWFVVDISYANVIVDGTQLFYIGWQWVSDSSKGPWLGVDKNPPHHDSSYIGSPDSPGSPKPGEDYMIRAIVRPTTYPPETLPDLVFQKVGFDKPEPFKDGDLIRFGAVIVNQGDGPAYNFRVEVYLDGWLYDSGTVSLGAHQSDTLWCDNPWKATEGTHTLTWIADTTNVVAESDENNNRMNRTFTVGLPRFDFSILVEPSSQTIRQGESATYGVTVKLLSESTQTVSLSLSGHHETMSYSFNPSSGNPTFTSTLIITTGTSTPPGTYTLTIIGSGGGKTHSASVTFSIKETISLEQLLKLAIKRRDAYDALYKVLNPDEVSIQIQDEYSRIYLNMWKDLYDVVKSGDSPEAMVGIFELMLNAISRLDTMGKLLYLQNILLTPQFIQLRTYVGQMRDLTDEEITAIQHQDPNSLKSIYEQEKGVLINIKNLLSIQVKPFLDNLMTSRVESPGPDINQLYNIDGVDVGETNSKEIAVQIDPDALYFNVYIIEKFPRWPPSWLFPKVGVYRVEIYDWKGQQIAQGTPSSIYRDYTPSITRRQVGIGSPTSVGAVQINYPTLMSLINDHKLSLRLKIVCLEKPKDLLGWFSATPDIILFIDMRSPSQPLNHPTTYETYAYENLNSVIRTLDNSVNADQIYINIVKQNLG
jgi:hypothetical protein